MTIGLNSRHVLLDRPLHVNGFLSLSTDWAHLFTFGHRIGLLDVQVGLEDVRTLLKNHRRVLLIWLLSNQWLVSRVDLILQPMNRH